MTTCPYCGGADLEPKYAGVQDRLGFVPGERAFYRCAACGSLALVPQPAAAELPGFYPPVYSFTREMGKGSRFKRFLSGVHYHLYFRQVYRSQVRNVMSACGWRRGDGRKLLDVGCGRGLMLQEFRRRGFDVHGLDVQPAVVRHLRDDLHIPAECADVSEMSKFHPPASFDLITTFFLVEHIPDVRAALAEMFALLKPGGWLTTAVPFADSVQAKVFGRRWINVTEAPRHLSLPTQAGIAAACRAAGFGPVTIRPDSALHCAGQVGSSLVSGGSLTHVYGRGGVRPLLKQGVGAAVMLAAVPWCALENHALGRASLGIAAAQKPA